jgi:hypothetical protein
MSILICRSLRYHRYVRADRSKTGPKEFISSSKPDTGELASSPRHKRYPNRVVSYGALWRFQAPSVKASSGAASLGVSAGAVFCSPLCPDNSTVSPTITPRAPKKPWLTSRAY